MSVSAHDVWTPRRSYHKDGSIVARVWTRTKCGNKCLRDVNQKLELNAKTGAVVVWGCMFMLSSGVYKNVLNAIMEDGEATVLGLRRSKPLFFHWEGAFLIQNSLTKDFQWALPHPHLTWGHSSAFQAYQWHVPIRAPIKSAPFPWNISKHFDGSGFPPAGFLESLPPFPPLFPPPPPSPPPSPPLLWANLRSFNISCDGQWSRKHWVRRGEHHRTGETCTKPFSWRSQCRWWEEDALRAAGGAWYGFHRSVLLISAGLDAKCWVCCCTCGSSNFLYFAAWLMIWVSFMEKPLDSLKSPVLAQPKACRYKRKLHQLRKTSTSVCTLTIYLLFQIILLTVDSLQPEFNS